MYTKEELLFYLEQIQGLMIIDKTGRLVYMNQQCADYIEVDRAISIGKHVEEVFPPTKMMDILRENKPMTTEFYGVDGRVSWSTRKPIYRDGEVVGVLEYDLFQESSVMDTFVKQYLSVNDELEFFKSEVKNLRNTKYSIDNIIGNSDKIQVLKEHVRHAATTNSTVIISGETGTGKELVAHSIHNLSARCLHNFIKVNAASLPENLIESELFGYEEGAFSGASKGGKKGKFELANGGTLFIDEIHQLPLHLQPKLLRVLQEKEIDRVGGGGSIPVDVRIIAATNEDLKRLVEKGEFREDLYYRLNIMEIKTVRLREVQEDIPVMVEHYVNRFNESLGRNVEHVEDSVMQKLISYEWPGNTRELNNWIESAMSYAKGNVLTEEDFKFSPLDAQKPSLAVIKNKENPIEEVKKDAERKIIIDALDHCNGNKTKAAELLKISRTLLHQKISRLQIQYKGLR